MSVLSCALALHHISIQLFCPCIKPYIQFFCPCITPYILSFSALALHLPIQSPLRIWRLAHIISITSPFQLHVVHRLGQASAIQICPGYVISTNSRSSLTSTMLDMSAMVFVNTTCLVSPVYISLAVLVSLIYIPGLSAQHNALHYISVEF